MESGGERPEGVPVLRVPGLPRAQGLQPAHKGPPCKFGKGRCDHQPCLVALVK